MFPASAHKDCKDEPFIAQQNHQLSYHVAPVFQGKLPVKLCKNEYFLNKGVDCN